MRMPDWYREWFHNVLVYVSLAMVAGCTALNLWGP